MSLPTRFIGKAIALLVVIGSLVGITSANAQVFLSFSRTGSEVTITWSSPIVYTLTASTGLGAAGNDPVFVFQSVGNSSNIFLVQGDVGGTAPTYTSTGANSGDGTLTINHFFASTGTQNSVHANDVVFYDLNDTAPTLLTAGDVFTLSAGSLRYDGSPETTSGYAGALPANGIYNTFITDGNNTYGSNLGSGVSAIPEPSTYAAIAGVAMLGFAGWRRRRNQSSVAALPATTV
jgi:hypothetical protein